MIGEIFTAVLYQPLYNLLIFIYGVAPWGGLGLGIIIMTIVVRLATMPLTYKSMRAQKELQEIQPKIEAIKAKYKGKPNQEDMAKELMGVYKLHNVNPFASCLPTIIQLVVFISLFHVLSAGMKTVDVGILYPFVRDPGVISHMFLGMNLSVVSIPLGILSAAMQYLQARQMVGKRPPKAVLQGPEGSQAMDEDMTATMNRMTLIMLPIMMLIMGVTTLPGGTTLYIFVSALITYGIYEFFLKPPAPSGPVVEVLPAPPKT
ncbi:MAG: YidC/Oxa1 family membrane protein insertase [Patescibacteria group bacterium]|jgi:YidC/Oxa1 family membrane protein insertase